MSIKKNGHNELIDNINIPEGLSEKVIENCSTKGRTPVFYPKKVAFAAVFLLTLSLGGIGVKAGLDTMHERVSSMDKKEKVQYESFREENDTRHYDEEVGDVAIIYSRDLTRNEAILEQKVEEEYMAGKFPKENIKFVKSESEIGSGELAVVKDINKVVLPEAELDEEQMLQYIDFKNKYFKLANEYYEENNADEGTYGDVVFEGKFADESFRNEVCDRAVKVYNKAFAGNINTKDGWYVKDAYEEDADYTVLLWKDDSNVAMECQATHISINAKSGKLSSAAKEYKWADTKDYTEGEIKKLADECKSDVLAFMKKYFETKKFVDCEYEIINDYLSGCSNVNNSENPTYDMIIYNVKYKNVNYNVKFNPTTKEVLSVDKEGN